MRATKHLLVPRVSYWIRHYLKRASPATASTSRTQPSADLPTTVSQVEGKSRYVSRNILPRKLRRFGQIIYSQSETQDYRLSWVEVVLPSIEVICSRKKESKYSR